MSKVRHYCATFFRKPEAMPEQLRYLILGEEICPTTGTTHWQAYMELFNPQRMTAIKRFFDDNTVHLEERKGTREEAKEYCMKDNKYTEFGTWIMGQGHRSDLDSVTAELVSGTKRIDDIALEDPSFFCRYRNGLKDIQQIADKRASRAFRHVEVTLLSGPTGCGKTRQAMESSDQIYKIEGTRLGANHSMGWFDGYEGEKTLVIDEYDNNVPISRLLTLLDGYQLQIPIKGSCTYARWDKVLITTNLKPHELHPQAKPVHQTALRRRITKIKNLWDEEVQG